MGRIGTDIEYIVGSFTAPSPLTLVIFAIMMLYALLAKVKMLRRSLMTDGKPPIENLLPLAAYDSDETGYWRRCFYSFAVIFGSGMFLAALLTQTITAFSPLVSISLFAAAGFLFAIPMVGTSRARVRFAVARLYSGNRRAIELPPPDLEAQYQLPCTWVQGRIEVGIGGVLYIGRKGLMFKADKRYLRNLKRPAEVIPLGGLTLTLAEPIQGRTVRQRFLMPRPLKPIELSWNGSNTRLYVPKPTETIEVIRNRLATLKQIPQ